MARLIPPMDDLPMSLGDHLHELRRRLIWPLVSLALVFFVAFGFEARLQQLFAQPVEWAIQINPEAAKTVGLVSPVKFQVLEVWEAPMASMMVSFYAAFFISFPVLVYHLWMFVGVGLVHRERRLAFLFVPAGIMFFYAGAICGFLFGLPYFYSFMIKWAANNPLISFNLQLKSYHSNFVFMTMIFGLIADIPWLIMVLVRVGFVTVDQLLRNWKMAILINTVIAAVVSPPDWFSMVAMMIPLFALYALGVGLSKVMMWHHGRQDAKEQAAELARMVAEEDAAHRAQAPQRDQPDSGGSSSMPVPVPAPVADHLDPEPVPRSSSIADELGSSSYDHGEGQMSEPEAQPSPGEPAAQVPGQVDGVDIANDAASPASEGADAPASTPPDEPQLPKDADRG